MPLQLGKALSANTTSSCRGPPARHPRRRANCSRTADTAARSSPVMVSVRRKETLISEARRGGRRFLAIRVRTAAEVAPLHRCSRLFGIQIAAQQTRFSPFSFLSPQPLSSGLRVREVRRTPRRSICPICLSKLDYGAFNAIICIKILNPGAGAQLN